MVASRSGARQIICSDLPCHRYAGPLACPLPLGLNFSGVEMLLLAAQRASSW